MVQRLVVKFAGEIERRENAMDVAVIVVELKRKLQFFLQLRHRGIGVRTKSIYPRLSEGACLPGMRLGIIGVERDGSVEQVLGRLVVGARGTMVQHLAGEQAF